MSKKNLNIVFVVHTVNAVGGVERVLSVFGNQMINLGHSVEIVSLLSSDDNCTFEFNSQISITHCGLDKLDARFLKNLLNQKNPDVVFTFHFSISALIASIRRKLNKNIKWIATEHKSPLYTTRMKKLLKLIIFFRLIIYKRADGFVVLTQNFADFYRKRGLKSVSTIPNACSFSLEAASKLTEKNIIAVGRLEEVKGFDELLYAVQLPFKKHQDWRLQIVGDGTERTMLEQLAKDLDIAEQVDFLGFRSDMINLYQNASISVISSRFEGFSMVALESLENGVPIVSFDLPSIKEIDNGSGCISLIKNRSKEEMGNAINELIENSDLRRSKGKMCKERAKAYSECRIAEMWQDYLSKTVN